MLDKAIKLLTYVMITITFNFVFISDVVALPAGEEGIKCKKPHKTSQKEPAKTLEINEHDDHWLQQFHQTVSNSVYQSAIWFDNFFLDEDTEQSNPKTSARIRLGWEPKSRDWNDFDTRFRIKVKLPHFKDKVDLILSDDDEVSQNQLPLENVNRSTETNDDSFAAAVRFTHKKTNDRLLESRIGISGGDIFVKAKHKRRYDWRNKHGLKIEPSIYYFLNDGLGAKLLLEYNYQLDKQSQFRINYSVRGSETYRGIRWKHGFYKLKQLEQDAASIIGLQIEGKRNDTDGFVTDKYTLSYRYRFNALRSWLFFEVEPFLEWPEDQHYTTTPGIALRVEGFFYKG